MPTRIPLHPRLTGDLLPYPARPPDWEPTLSGEPGFFEQLPDLARRGVNTLSDVLFGATPEERAQNIVASTAGPLGTAATTARRMLRPLLSGNLDPLLAQRTRPEWVKHGLSPRPLGPSGNDWNLNTPFTPDERQIVRQWKTDPYLQETPIQRYDDPAWDDAHQRMNEVMKTWAQNTSPWVRDELDDIVTNTEFGRHYLDRLHGLLRESYPSGRVPLYRGLGVDELQKILTHYDWKKGVRQPDYGAYASLVGPTGSWNAPPQSAMLQSFTLSPNMSRRFAGPGGSHSVLHGDVPVENIRGHMRSPTMQEEELIVNVLPSRRELLPDWKVAEGSRNIFKPGGAYPNWGKTSRPEYWQNLMKSW
jgi:hypothetical protein